MGNTKDSNPKHRGRPSKSNKEEMTTITCQITKELYDTLVNYVDVHKTNNERLNISQVIRDAVIKYISTDIADYTDDTVKTVVSRFHKDMADDRAELLRINAQITSLIGSMETSINAVSNMYTKLATGKFDEADVDFEEEVVVGGGKDAE